MSVPYGRSRQTGVAKEYLTDEKPSGLRCYLYLGDSQDIVRHQMHPLFCYHIFRQYSSFRILNFPLLVCTIFASNPVPSISTIHQHEYRSSSSLGLLASNFPYCIPNL